MSGLGEYHHAEEAQSKNSKLIHWIIGLVIVAGIGVYALTSGFFSSHPAQPGTTQNYPRGL
jgi:hypothetical protein